MSPAEVDDLLRLATPEKISFEYELAGPVRRLGSWLIDVLVVCCVYGLVVLLISVLAGFLILVIAPTAGDSLAEWLGGLTVAVLLVGAFLAWWFYGAWMEAVWNGQTVGKRLCDLRVLSADGGAIGSGQALIRNLLRYADLLPLVPLSWFLPEGSSSGGPQEPALFPTMMVGLLSMLVFPGFRRIGDLVAGTMVVRERYSAMPEPIRFEDPRVEQLAAVLPGNFVPGRSLSLALADYVDRRRTFGPDRCREIAGHLGPALLRVLELPADTCHDLLLCSLHCRVFSGGEVDRESAGSRRR